MAKITGVKSGLIVSEASWETPKFKVKKQPEPKLPTECECSACGARWVTRDGRNPMDSDGQCSHCSSFFGSGFMRGVTNEDPQRAKDKVRGLQEQKFLMILREIHLAARDGNQIEIGAGDIFQCAHTPFEAEHATPSKERTWGMFTIRAQIGPYEVTLLPHEWSPIPFVRVMALKNAGEIVESFIATNDANGHFTPTPEMKAQIDATFGRLTGATPWSTNTRRKTR